jgi:hypothetical protein
MEPNGIASTAAAGLSRSSAYRRPEAPSDVAALLGDLDNYLKAISIAQRQYGLTTEELIVLLTLGRLSVSVSSVGITIRSVKCSELSRSMKSPKETVRRKLIKLVDCGFATVTTSGIILSNIDRWVQFTRLIVREQGPREK